MYTPTLCRGVDFLQSTYGRGAFLAENRMSKLSSVLNIYMFTFEVFCGFGSLHTLKGIRVRFFGKLLVFAESLHIYCTFIFFFFFFFLL